MRVFKLLLKPIKQENDWNYEDKEAIKLGKVAFAFKGKLDDEEVSFKKGDEIYYQYGTNAKIEGEEYVLVNLSSIIWQK